MNLNEKLLFSEKEAALILNMSVSFLQKSRSITSTNISDGEAPIFRKNMGRVKYHKQDLIDFANNLPSFGKVSTDSKQTTSNVVPIAIKTVLTDDSPVVEEDWASLMA
jgi:hypothetical protein